MKKKRLTVVKVDSVVVVVARALRALDALDEARRRWGTAALLRGSRTVNEDERNETMRKFIVEGLRSVKAPKQEQKNQKKKATMKKAA